jgi:cytochrome c peroxidase
LKHQNPLASALPALLALLLAACGGGAAQPPVDTVAVGAPASAEEAAGEDAAAVREAAEQQALLEVGVPTLIARTKPQFALGDFFRPRELFEEETFHGNGRTCRTCHSRDTGTVSPQDAERRFAKNKADPLFVGDGSDDGAGNGATRMRANATVLVRVPLHDNVSLADDPSARSVLVRRGIPSTLNTPALDPVLMYDGRDPDLVAQARGAIAGHAQAGREPTPHELKQIAAFQHTPGFFSSFGILKYAYTGIAPKLPEGRTASEKRGRRFFIDAAPSGDLKTGSCALCHSGPMLNETNQFVFFPPFQRGGRFQSVAVSEFNDARNPAIDFVFRNADGSTTLVSSPDPGRALITGDANDVLARNAFKIPSLWGVARTAPYFHDNSAKTLEDVARHYARFFAVISPIVLTEQDQSDMVAYMKLLR